MAIIGISTAVLTVFIAVVEQRGTGRGQQPTVGLEGGVVGRNIPRLSGKAVLNPLVVGITGSSVCTAGEARNIMTANIGNHQGAGRVLVLTSVGPVIQVLIVFIAGDKHVVHDGMVEHEISLTVQAVRSHVGVDGSVLGLVVLKGMARPTHGRFPLEVDIVAHGLKPFVDLSDHV